MKSTRLFALAALITSTLALTMAQAADKTMKAKTAGGQDLVIARITIHQKTIWMRRIFLHQS